MRPLKSTRFPDKLPRKRPCLPLRRCKNREGVQNRIESPRVIIKNNCRSMIGKRHRKHANLRETSNWPFRFHRQRKARKVTIDVACDHNLRLTTQRRRGHTKGV